MSRPAVLCVLVLILSGFLVVLPGGTAFEESSDLPSRKFANGTVSVDLLSPFNYALIPPGTEVSLSIAGSPFTQVRYSLDGGPTQSLPPPYVVDTSSWPSGTHLLAVEVLNGSALVGSETFVLFFDGSAMWPPDTIAVDVVLIGFDESPNDVAALLRSEYAVFRILDESLEEFDLTFDFSVQSADASYRDGLVAYLQSKATYRDTPQGRLNLSALIDQRDSGTPRDIFDPLEGWEIRTNWAELYLHQLPPTTSLREGGYTVYLLNLSALDDPLAGTDHWFVQDTMDPDTNIAQDWWRLEWDNDLNTPVAYPLNIWGGRDHAVYIDPTAYQWYLDWTYVWWEGGDVRAPYGLQYEEVDSASRLAYLSGVLNDLVEGLGATLPGTPPTQASVLIQNYVLSGSQNHSLEELLWVSSDLALESYLEGFLPFKEWTVETTFDLIDNYTDLKDFVDSVTTFVGERGFIDGVEVWNYLFSNKDQFVWDNPDAFEVLTVNLLYDNRSMVYGPREFTGLGGSGITAIFLKTERLFYSDGRRQKGLTSIISHETGHNLGYGHQFGPNYTSDFVNGNMGYFMNDLSYGLFWEDALHRLYVREKLRGVLSILDSREPLDLNPEFTAFYSDYLDLDFLQAHEDLVVIEAMLTDSVAPVANAGSDFTGPEDTPIILDAGGSSDNFRVVSYTWDFGDGSQITTETPVVEKVWEDPGEYIVGLTVEDAAGNLAGDTMVATILDITPPTVTILSPTNGSRLSSAQIPLIWRATDNGPGIQRMRVSLDGDAVDLQGNVGEYTLIVEEDGVHVVTLEAFDLAGLRDIDSVFFHVEGVSQPTAPVDLWTVIIAVLTSAALIALAVYLYRRYRREHPPEPPES